MATQPDGGTPGETGSDGGDQEAVDLRALEAQVQENSKLIRELVHRLSRVAGFTASELEGLRVD